MNASVDRCHLDEHLVIRVVEIDDDASASAECRLQAGIIPTVGIFQADIDRVRKTIMDPVDAMCYRVRAVATKTDLDCDIAKTNKPHHARNSLVRKQMSDQGQDQNRGQPGQSL